VTALVSTLALLKNSKPMLMSSRLDSVMNHVCKLANHLMEGKGKTPQSTWNNLWNIWSCRKEDKRLIPELCESAGKAGGIKLSLQQTKILHPYWGPALSPWAHRDAALPCSPADSRSFGLPASVLLLALPQVALISMW